MAESTLNLTYSQLKSEIGHFLGFGRGADAGETAWNTRQSRTIEDCLKSGLSMFYFPTPLPGESTSVEWSFIKPTRSFSLLSGATELELPDDFGGMDGDVRLLESGRFAIPIRQVTEQMILQKRFAVPDMTGQPLMCAVETPSKTNATRSQRSKMIFFPTADQDYTVEFQYYLQPDTLSTSFPYALGGAVHAETIKAAVKAAAEMHQDNERGTMYELFVERMKASVSLDNRNKAQYFGYNGDPSYNAGRARYVDRVQGPATYNGVTP